MAASVGMSLMGLMALLVRHSPLPADHEHSMNTALPLKARDRASDSYSSLVPRTMTGAQSPINV